MEAYAMPMGARGQVYWPNGIEMAQKTEKKVFINNYKKASFTCPKCDKRKTLNVSGYRNVREEVKITHRCSCGNSYTLLLERRRYRRKNVTLSGAYVWKERRRKMIVKDISRGGVKLELKVEKDMKIGDKMFVELSLDDPKRTLIQKEVVIRNIRERHIGVEFFSPKIITLADKKSDKALAAYMLRP